MLLLLLLFRNGKNNYEIYFSGGFSYKWNFFNSFSFDRNSKQMHETFFDESNRKQIYDQLSQAIIKLFGSRSNYKRNFTLNYYH